ncbi:MAG: RNA polymerase subunit sigma-70 [Sporichthyaceae bacterium]|nr:RNA polymerase subunit sigma-70 [Sporichthyaceae bacterium]
MSVITSSGADSEELLAAARAGDQRAFETLVAADHQRAVHLHCYRMLGSLQDAEDATQETLVRAWRNLAGFEQRAPLRHWLYRIATTTCLKMLAARDRRPVSFTELTYLQPYPDRLLDRMPAADPDPAAVAENRETVALAFIAALQLLPASQRAVLVLREVLAWRAAEVADLLGSSVAAVNSALQRARTTMRTAAPTPVAPGLGTLDARDREVVDRFVDAWQRNDVQGLAALLREDAILRMPPERAEFAGRSAVAAFFATVPAGGRLDRIPLTVTRANGQPCLAAYLADGEGGRREPYGLMVLTVAGGEVSAITGFPDPTLFEAFGLTS